ncbi:tripartite tricarboxylate transporter substrate binding protein [Bradyrhizobium sp. LHD-71]|uniref:Bug family tripartite tricarboxylate transporter substrate binding protein n=1 Tax=Bradyrhizobium sp. LHD-71 TaxID=3072141 RepID=UPI00280FB274|nr:tripartite tricarboxylate transporter substrate binding protein [Bradyrhizobium sp. LHD-71]MDQ8731855.1 tripartite tricarboxylate transporter substrate binding protein [Bradyrhizobium sp. LHD-71]
MKPHFQTTAALIAFLVVTATMASVTGASASDAETAPYPHKPIRLIVPQPPGGTGDSLGRVVAKHLFAAMGQPVIVENRPGASSSIGVELAARSAPDGYTLLLASSTGLIVNPLMMPSLRVDPIKELDPVGIISEGTILLVAHPDFPANDLRELVTMAKKAPGEISYATWGPASPAYVCMQMIASATGIQMIHVAYKGGTPLVTDMIGGHIKVGFADSVSAYGPIQAGKLKVLASCAGRSDAFPDAPSFKDQGIDFEFSWRNFLLVPAGTPAPIVKRLNEAFTRIQATAEFAKQLKELGSSAVAIQPPLDELKPIIRRDMHTLKSIVGQADIKPE